MGKPEMGEPERLSFNFLEGSPEKRAMKRGNAGGMKRGFRSGDVPKAGEDGPAGNPGPAGGGSINFTFQHFEIFC